MLGRHCVHPGSGQGWVKINPNQLLRAWVSQLKKGSQWVELMDRVHSFYRCFLWKTLLMKGQKGTEHPYI